MSIALYLGQGKAALANKYLSMEGLLGLACLCLTIGAFGMGRLFGQGEMNSEIILKMSTTTYPIATEPKTPLPNPGVGNRGLLEGQVVASKNGTKFHYPWCPGANQIKNENKIFFTDESAAIAAGYSKAVNCN